MPGDLTELSAHLFDDPSGGLAYRAYGERTEEEGEHDAEEAPTNTSTLPRLIGMMRGSGTGLPVMPLHLLGGNRLVADLLAEERRGLLVARDGERLLVVVGKPGSLHLGHVSLDELALFSELSCTIRVEVEVLHVLCVADRVFAARSCRIRRAPHRGRR